jgi:hypothetical protein
MTDSNTHSNPVGGTDTPSDPETVDAAGAEGNESTGMLGAPRPGQASTTEKDPADWATGDEPMTGAQRSYLDTLAREAGEQLDPHLTKAEASEHIDRLQSSTGRGSS